MNGRYVPMENMFKSILFSGTALTCQNSYFSVSQFNIASSVKDSPRLDIFWQDWSVCIHSK